MAFNNKKIFILITSNCIGDILLTSILVQNIKNLYLNSKVIILTTFNTCVDIAKNIEGVDEVYFWDRTPGFKKMFNFIRNFQYQNIYAIIPVFDSGRMVLFAKMFNPKYILSSSAKFILRLFIKLEYHIEFKKQSVQKLILNYLPDDKLYNINILFNENHVKEILVANKNNYDCEACYAN